MALWRYRKTRQDSTKVAGTLGIVGISVVVATAIEVAQLGLISRVSSLTDVILAGFAATVGGICAQYTLDFYRHAVGARVELTSASVGGPRSASTWSHSDALIATLIPDPEPEPDPCRIVRRRPHDRGGRRTAPAWQRCIRPQVGRAGWSIRGIAAAVGTTSHHRLSH
ncbi:MAG: VanZ family protein [Planctomycetes bacterium]|nr:VanZ family protein [Planctomycetota bacterium]